MFSFSYRTILKLNIFLIFFSITAISEYSYAQTLGINSKEANKKTGVSSIGALGSGVNDFEYSKALGESEKREIIESLSPEVVIEGGARGADTIAKEVAESLGIKVLEFPANWEKYGRRAGIIRNEDMLRIAKPDVVFGFPLANSIGTFHMLEIAKKAGVKTQYIGDYL